MGAPMGGSESTVVQSVITADGQREKRRHKPPQFRRYVDRYFVALTVVPTFVLMVCVFGVPLLFSLYLSFTITSIDGSLLSGRFVGWANYDDLLHTPVFNSAIYITLGYTAAAVAAQMLLGLVIALLLNVDLPGMRFFRTALIVPMMIT